MLVTPGAARWLRFGLLVARFLVWHSRPRLWLGFCFGQLLIANCQLLLHMPRLPAVGDLGQKLADALNVLLCPVVNSHSLERHDVRRRNFALGYVTAQSHGRQPSLLAAWRVEIIKL